LERAALELQSGKHGLPRAKIPRQQSAADTGITADSCPRPREWKISLFQDQLSARLAEMTGMSLF
jgi:hypothetical protein